MEDVATPTYSMKNCLQRALIGNHSNCIVRPLEAILKETVILKRRNLITIALSRAPNVMLYCSPTPYPERTLFCYPEYFSKIS